jgi:hypothetical protein
MISPFATAIIGWKTPCSSPNADKDSRFAAEASDRACFAMAVLKVLRCD